MLLTRAVLSLAVAETVLWGILHYSFGVLLRPIATDLGCSEAVASGAFSVALLTGGLAAIHAGRAIDRFGARSVMICGAVLAVAAFALLSTVRGVVTLYLAWAAIGAAQAAVLYEPAFAAVTAWHPVERDRLRALLILTSLAGVASTIFVPWIARLTGERGWRGAVWVLAFALAAVVPLLVSLPRVPVVRPRSRITAHDDVRRLSVVFGLHAFVSAALAVHLVSHLIDGGMNLARAASIAGLLGVAQVGGRIASPLFRAIADSGRRLTVLLGAQTLALVAITAGAPIPGILLFGVTNGLMTLERATIVFERFGPERYGENCGRVARGGLLARAAAPFAVGLVRTHGGALLAFLGLSALLLVAVAVASLEAAHRPTAG